MERPIPLIPPYPDLPVVQKREDFLRLLKQHQVVIVQADTGSGKSTQLPKFLLEAGLATSGRIGVTQPRRIAALSIADRLREELKDETLVSTRIRFLEEGSADAPLKVMTDGILLQEFRKDRLLKQYGALMIDEAHERSLNIDILLGILRGVVEARPEFRLVVASATLDAELFREFYPGSAILSAEGRLFPVQVEYRPPEAGTKQRGDSGLIDQCLESIHDLMAFKPDNLLCFLPTERDIQDIAEDLAAQLEPHRYEILPLFGRLSPAEQRKVFRDTGKVKVVLATNIAETSLTIPGIAYVVDAGLARISRYNAQSRIQGLPVEEISQASARQRTGRAGRVKPGRCIRLYAEKDIRDRPEYTDPEIRRANLANVVLQLRSLGLSLDQFPFLQPPPRSAFRGAYRQLHELGALAQPEADAKVTPLGQEMARLPMDVALSSVLLRARQLGILKPALVVCAALSIQDPRIVPMDGPEREKARTAHRKHGGNRSDFLTLLKVWNHVHASWEKGNSLNKLRKLCEENWLHFLRLREWMDLYEQYGRILDVEDLSRLCPLESFHRDSLHIALLGGFLGGLARRDIENACYRMPGGREGNLFPGSDVYGKSPEWVFAAEVRETSRVFLARAAEIRPEWIIQVAGDFCTRRWHDPQWNPERGYVEAVEEVSFRGMVLTRGQRVDYARVDPEACAKIFWREAVVEGRMARPFLFMENNARVLEQLRAVEARQRRWGLAPSEEMLVEYYQENAPTVTSLPSLKKWIQGQGVQGEKALAFTTATWLSAADQSLVSNLPVSKGSYSLGDAWRSKKPVLAENAGNEEGTRETFVLDGERINGLLIFDRNHTRDGLSLDFTLRVWSGTTPARLMRQLPQWRSWVLDAVWEQIPKATRKQLEPLREALDDDWEEQLGRNAHSAPLPVLLELFRTLPGADDVSINLNAQKETHLRLHCAIRDVDTGRKLQLELSPEWGTAQMFAASRATFFPERGGVAEAPHSTLVWKLPHSVEFAYGAPRESQGQPMLGYAFRPQSESMHWSLHAPLFEMEQTPWSELILDRLQMLEAMGAGPRNDWWCLPRKEVAHWWLQGNRTAWDIKILAQKLERFSGLEGLQGRKVADFQALGRKTEDEPESIRMSLLRLTWDSALLGMDAFAKAWNLLKECTLRLRRGQKMDVKWQQIAEDLSKCEEFQERMLLVQSLFGQNVEFSVALMEYRAAQRALAQRQKTLRSDYRQWLAHPLVPQNRRSDLRDILVRMESGRLDYESACQEELTLQILAEEVRLNVLRKPRPNAEEQSEAVSVDALAKLRAKFKGK